jgi:hypothetical protein
MVLTREGETKIGYITVTCDKYANQATIALLDFITHSAAANLPLGHLKT